MKFEEILPLLRAGKIARLPHWHATLGLALTEEGFEWVEPAWRGFVTKGEGAYIDHKMLLSEEWIVIG